ncbi:MAG: tetratricopeptide repeat protein [Steroidobacteraceae bacterium]
MNYWALLMDGTGGARCAPVYVRTLREMKGMSGMSVHFRPVRKDSLYESAKTSGAWGERVLRGEGKIRGQLWVEYEVGRVDWSVIGRSADLLFALALVTVKWGKGWEWKGSVAATGRLGEEGEVYGVEGTVQKVSAALGELRESGERGVVFYPRADQEEVGRWLEGVGEEALGGVEVRPVGHVEEALGYLGYRLERVYVRNPFRGLEHFDVGDHGIFFGREGELAEVLEQLLRRERAGRAGLLVEGASGSGKSSFLRAGVLYELKAGGNCSESMRQALLERPVSEGLEKAIWRPGLVRYEGDESEVVGSIVAVWAKCEEWATGWSEGAGNFAGLLRAFERGWPGGKRFVWLIDQCEELFGRGFDEELIEGFGGFLRALQGLGVWTLASIRADATPLLKSYRSLRAVYGADEGQYYLESMSGRALDEVIEGPARVAQLDFERDESGVGLNERLREDAYREKESLPMLEFTLNELYARRRGRQLTYEAYREVGGLAGSIATTAQRVLAGVQEAEREAAQRGVFRSLVRVDESGGAERRYARLQEIKGSSRVLVERLIEARLCVTDQRQGEAVVAFAHDTLLGNLPALSQWLKNEAGLMQTRELAQKDARAWSEHRESVDWLAAADKLALYRGLEAAQVELGEGVRRYLSCSVLRQRRVRRLRVAGVTAVVLMAVGVMAAAAAYGLQARRAKQAADMAARRGEFLTQLLKSADPHGGKRDITVAQVLDASAQGLDRSLGKEPLVEASMLGVIASTNGSLGRYDQGFAASDRELALLREHGGSDLEMARALIVRGELYRAHGLYAEAQAPLRHALSLLSGLSDVEADRGKALDELGMALVNTRNEREAEGVLRQAIALEERIHSDTAEPAEPMQNLSVLLSNEARYEEAAQLMNRAVEILRQHASPDDPNMLMALGNYASELMLLHQPVKAEPVMREALARSAKVLGPKHTDTLIVQLQLGDTLTMLHRYAEAEGLLRAAAEELERNEGPSNKYTMGAWTSLAVSQCEGGDLNAGLELARRVAEIRKQQSTLEGDWHASAIQTVVGLCLVQLKRYAEAEPILTEARSRLEAARGPGHYTTQLNYQASQALYAATGRTDQADQMSRKILH